MLRAGANAPNPSLSGAPARRFGPMVGGLMKYHVLTVALLLAALALYAVGIHAGGSLVFLVGAAFELRFWVRVVRGSGRAPAAVSSYKR